MPMLNNSLHGTLAALAVSILFLGAQADLVMAQVGASKASRYRFDDGADSGSSSRVQDKRSSLNPVLKFEHPRPAFDFFTDANESKNIRPASYLATRKFGLNQVRLDQGPDQRFFQESAQQFGQQQYRHEFGPQKIQEFGQQHAQEYGQPDGRKFEQGYGQQTGQDYSQEYARGGAQEYGQDYRQQYERDYAPDYRQDYEQAYDRNYDQVYDRNYEQIYDRNFEQESASAFSGEESFNSPSGTFLDGFAGPEQFPFRDQYQAFPARTGFGTLYGKPSEKRTASRPTDALFGIHESEVCDEWSRFGPCIEADYICSCGGLKLNPRHRLFNCKRPSRDPCDEVVGCKLCSKRRCGKLDCKSDGGQGNACHNDACQDQACRERGLRKHRFLDKAEVDYGNSNGAGPYQTQSYASSRESGCSK